MPYNARLARLQGPSGLGGGPQSLAACDVAFGCCKQPRSSAVRDSALRQGRVQGLACATRAGGANKIKQTTILKSSGVDSCCKAQLGKCVGQALDHIVSRLAGLESNSRCVGNSSIRGKGHPDARPLPCLPTTASIPVLCHALGQSEFMWPHVTRCPCSNSECSCKAALPCRHDQARTSANVRLFDLFKDGGRYFTLHSGFALLLRTPCAVA